MGRTQPGQQVQPLRHSGTAQGATDTIEAWNVVDRLSFLSGAATAAERVAMAAEVDAALTDATVLGLGHQALRLLGEPNIIASSTNPTIVCAPCPKTSTSPPSAQPK